MHIFHGVLCASVIASEGENSYHVHSFSKSNLDILEDFSVSPTLEFFPLESLPLESLPLEFTMLHIGDGSDFPLELREG